jgi:hypothetical protein
MKTKTNDPIPHQMIEDIESIQDYLRNLSLPTKHEPHIIVRNVIYDAIARLEGIRDAVTTTENEDSQHIGQLRAALSDEASTVDATTLKQHVAFIADAEKTAKRNAAIRQRIEDMEPTS